MPLYIAQSGDMEGCHAYLTDGQTLKDRATQLFTKYKSGALVTQLLWWLQRTSLTTMKIG